MADVPTGHFYLGGVVDPATHQRTGDPIHYEAAHLTTHGVIVGMTGSGKTGLGVCVLEEALLSDIPTLIIDPKGDLGNLLLTFPELRPADFAPWVNESDARQAGQSVDEYAAGVADLWRTGLADWGIEPSRIADLRDRAAFTIYTPGSSAGVPVDILGSLQAPPPDTDPEAITDEIESWVSSLLTLVGIESDPLSGREHILLATIIGHAWAQGQNLDLASLLGRIQTPPFRKLGVLELDTFFPEKDRMALLLKLNGLIASPAFASWTGGAPLDIADLLRASNGRPRAAIMSLGHLNEDERQFAVTLLLSKLVTWMRSQSGTTDLRALVYMDEVAGYAPPTANPPAKKPILTILKQARAFGVGMVLSTQNPVDLDYKAISNAGTWMIGRLQTDQDKNRLMDGLRSAAGSVDLAQIEATISGLGKREFVYHSTRRAEPVVFGTRWAMSYLRGPLSRDQIEQLAPTFDLPTMTESGVAGTGGADPAGAAGTTAGTRDPHGTEPESGQEEELSPDETSVAPEIADGTPVRWLDPGAPWLTEVGGDPAGTRFRAAVATRVQLLFDETKADLRHTEEWEAVVIPLSEDPDADHAVAVDFDDRDLRTIAPDGAVYELPSAPVHTKTYFKGMAQAIRNLLYRDLDLDLFRNPELKLYSRVGEPEDGFRHRCLQAAGEGADGEAVKIRDQLEAKMDKIQLAIAKHEDRLAELSAQKDNRRSSDLLDIGASVLGGLLGGRKSSRGLAGAVRKLGRSRSSQSNTAERMATVHNRINEKNLALDDLELDLQEALLDIDDEWTAKAGAIEPFEVSLERQDIDVDDLVLVWIPVNT
ncbi:MAG: ATP-binding protein [Actinomycetia bacterium]|nr:ATP-binding protein [Actinomycetes bacterium]